MASAPRIRSTTPDTSELGIRTFNPVTAPRNETVIQIDKPTPPPRNSPTFDKMSEREQIRMLWGSRRRKTGKSRKSKNKKKRSTRRR
jgi:hypothetical protein